jgi:hypothetical protein
MVLHARLAYCSGCDRKVRVVVNPRVLKEGREPTEKDLVCLEHGDSCNGELCPLFEVPSDEMKERYGDLLDEAKARLEVE